MLRTSAAIALFVALGACQTGGLASVERAGPAALPGSSAHHPMNDMRFDLPSF